MTSHQKFNVAVVGATGIVGQEFVKLLKERDFPLGELKLFASQKSAGTWIPSGEKKFKVAELKPGCFKECTVAFFSAGADISKEWAPRAIEEGCFVIDNSSAFRMEMNIPLVVPEVNSHRIPKKSDISIIANPNCSTIQLVMALKPLHDAFDLKNVTVATYQSVSGAGSEGIDELLQQTKEHLENTKLTQKVFPHPIAFNNIPQIDIFDESGFTFEEKKVILETQKILNLPNLDVSVTAVRTPTIHSHSEAVWIELGKEVSRTEVVDCLKKVPGITIIDDPNRSAYPLNRDALGKDDVFIGRIRRDLKNPRRWLMWIVSDNVRKGAALNGIQIAEKLLELD